ncbi:MAG TPA: amino acid--[acyl-carrier-protein] ligase [Acetobacteraceae bacterium]|nr:amino acid--[acyl-carrier-protein] ligase [Acetobacteraceae bacterium]
MDGVAAQTSPDGASRPAPADAGEAFRAALFEAGILIPTGEDGIYVRSLAFESVLERLDRIFASLSLGDGAEALRFPPGMTWPVLSRSGYLKNFPHLIGTIHCFCGTDAGHRAMLACLESGEDWTAQQQFSGLSLTPAACYPVYGIVAARGPLPRGGTLMDVMSWCFRHEPSPDPARMQMFRMHEQVAFGSAEQIEAFRSKWMERLKALADRLRLPSAFAPANDPFFGRPGRIMAEAQRDQALKQELLIPIASEERPTACASVNCHRDAFGRVWEITTPNGEVAHTACCGLGLERMALALFRHHGMRPDTWPADVRAALDGAA